MAQDLPVAADLIEVAATHIAEHTRPALPGIRAVEAAIAATVLRLARHTPDGHRPVLKGVALFLVKRARPALHGWTAFETLMTAHLLMIAQRELHLATTIRAADEAALRRLFGADPRSAEDLEQALVDRFRADSPLTVDEWTRALDYLRGNAVERLRIANPDYPIREG